MRPQTLQASIFRPLFHVGESLGIPRARLLEATGETEERLASLETRVPYEALRRVWELLVATGGSEPLGVRLAEALEPTLKKKSATGTRGAPVALGFSWTSARGYLL